MSQPIYALILAGGSGERFWPLSRRTRPKQLLQLVSEKTLLQETVTRLDGLVPPERILILTNVEQEAAVRALLRIFRAPTLWQNQRSATPLRLSLWGWAGSRRGITWRRW
jgi:mannose-1-phosphate guanylyltransferase